MARNLENDHHFDLKKETDIQRRENLEIEREVQEFKKKMEAIFNISLDP